MHVPLLAEISKDTGEYGGCWGSCSRSRLAYRVTQMGISGVPQSSDRYWRGKGGALGDAKLCLKLPVCGKRGFWGGREWRGAHVGRAPVGRGGDG